MTIGAVGGSGPVQGNSGIEGGSLSVESMMMYCASQLNELDSSIKGQMAQQQQSRNAAAALNKVKAALTADKLDPNNKEPKLHAMQAMKEAYDAMPPGDPGRAELDKVFQRFAATGCLNDGYDQAGKLSLANVSAADLEGIANTNDSLGRNLIDGKELTAMSNDIDGIIGSVTKGAELKMIDMQSKVSQRQMAIQLITQLISKINESAAAIVNQIGKG